MSHWQANICSSSAVILLLCKEVRDSYLPNRSTLFQFLMWDLVYVFNGHFHSVPAVDGHCLFQHGPLFLVHLFNFSLSWYSLDVKERRYSESSTCLLPMLMLTLVYTDTLEYKTQTFCSAHTDSFSFQ